MSPDGWFELGRATIVSQGRDERTFLPIDGLVMAPGETYGLYVFMTDYVTQPPPPGVTHMRYTNIPPALGSYENDDLKLEGDIAKGAPPFTGP